MTNFNRRIYGSMGEFLTDFRRIMARRKEIRTLMSEEALQPAFRERMMLAVTAVYGCRYCSFAHAREALSRGVSQEEIEALGESFFEGSPPEEIPALLYAQHWAEANGEPDAAARDQVVARYGEQVVEAMELALRMIRMGNLSGNTWDYFLHRISFGRWGAWR
jgi:AhpD family alkylhydroperoxidase